MWLKKRRADVLTARIQVGCGETVSKMSIYENVEQSREEEFIL